MKCPCISKWFFTNDFFRSFSYLWMQNLASPPTRPVAVATKRRPQRRSRDPWCPPMVSGRPVRYEYIWIHYVLYTKCTPYTLPQTAPHHSEGGIPSRPFTISGVPATLGQRCVFYGISVWPWCLESTSFCDPYWRTIHLLTGTRVTQRNPVIWGP